MSQFPVSLLAGVGTGDPGDAKLFGATRLAFGIIFKKRPYSTAASSPPHIQPLLRNTYVGQLDLEEQGLLELRLGAVLGSPQHHRHVDHVLVVGLDVRVIES